MCFLAESLLISGDGMKKDKIYPGKFLGLLLLSACFAACAVFGGRLFRAGLEYKRQEADLLRMRRLTGGRKEDIGQAGAEMTGQNAEKGADRAAAERAGQAAEDGAALWEDQTARLDRCRRSREANPDTIGWISIPGTEIDYPVMYTPEDPDFYLNHGFDQEPSAGGMIYLDAGDDCGGRKAQEPAEAEAAKQDQLAGTGRYHVILGSFKVEDNAGKMDAMLKNNGYTPRVIKFNNGFSAVSAASYDNYRDALRAMYDIMEFEYCPEDVWIYDLNQKMHSN